MSRYWKLGGIAVLAAALLAPAASARPPFGFYGPHFYGPSFGFYYGPGWYGQGWYGPGYYGLGWYEPYGYVSAASAGKVKFDTEAKDAEVYVDGGYAGRVKQLGTFPLKAGGHDIELRDPNGQAFYQEHVNVIPGKTITLKP